MELRWHIFLFLQLSIAISIFEEVKGRHLSLCHSTIQCSLTYIQQHLPATSNQSGDQHTPSSDSDSTPLPYFTSNMIKILRGVAGGCQGSKEG